MCTQSLKSSFLRYSAREIITQTKESSLIFISVLFWVLLHLVLPVYTGNKWSSISGAKGAQIAAPNGTVLGLFHTNF